MYKELVKEDTAIVVAELKRNYCIGYILKKKRKPFHLCIAK